MKNLSNDLRGEIELAASGKCLLWVDPAQSDPFDDALVQRCVRVPIQHWRFAQHRAPYLVELDLAIAGDAALFDESVELALQAWTVDSLYAERGQPICGWVSTQASAQAVANHWGWRCHVHGHDGKAKLLRFQDPGVREWLWPTLSVAQQRALMGPAAQLFGLGRNKSVLRHACPSGEALPNYFKLDDRQWQEVGDYAAVHAAWLACARAPEALRSTAPFPTEAVLASLTHAPGLGVTQESERSKYAMHAVQLGARFYADARMHPVWERTRADSYYGSAIEDVFGCAASALHLQWTVSEEQTAWPT